MSWIVPRIWENGEVWIIGGGPSIPKQFNIPEDVVRKVISGALLPSAYSPYMEAIHNKHVIGINVAYTIGEWIDFVYFGDTGFFTRHYRSLAEFPGIRISSHPCIKQTDWVKYISAESRKYGISPTPDRVYWNGNSGAAAISIAANTGAKRIVLLGFDMQIGENKMQHWHDLYSRGPVDNPGRETKLPFERHKIGFKQIAIDAKKRGIELLNASPTSSIVELTKVAVKDLI
jgi:hypothetical protein